MIRLTNISKTYRGGDAETQALDDLSLEKLWIIYPGKQRYLIHENVEVLPLEQIPAYWKYTE